MPGLENIKSENMKIFYLVYHWFIAWPLALISTFLTAVFTIILSPVLPNNSIAYLPARIWGRFVCLIFFVKVKFVNKNLIRPKQSYVIIANHESLFDILAIYGWLPVIFKWMMKAELRKVPAIGQACVAAGHIFVDRSNPIAAKESLLKAEQQLKNGVSVVIFPEGTRTKTGKLGKLKKGAFKMAADLNLPILPIYIQGSFERVPNNGFFFRPGTITLTISPEIHPSDFESQNDLIQKSAELLQ